jgi:cytochrome b involved in lipid metabolism
MALKRLVYSAFIAFVASAATIWVMGKLHAQDKIISAAELSGHSSQADCWVAIEGNVYALSDYIPNHPAPARVIVDWCGKDATEAFNTKGHGRPHSASARALLPSYRIGTYNP